MLDMVEKVVNIDGTIILGFLLFNLFVGIYFSKSITNIKEYALGSRNFGTATIAYTIAATFIGSGSFVYTIYQIYKEHSMIALSLLESIAEGLSFLLIAFFYAPRMQSFLGKLSIAEAIGERYSSNKVRLCTAIASIIFSLGIIVMQFFLQHKILSNFFGNEGIYVSTCIAIVIITYSAYGGIRAVTFTDIIQFFTFGIGIPMTAFFIWKGIDENAVIDFLGTNSVFNFDNIDFSSSLILKFSLFALPWLDPAMFQRISMSKDIRQAMKSFTIASLIIISVLLVLSLIGIFLAADSSARDLGDLEISSYIINHYLNVGFKGIFIIGIIAITSSTADSYINSAAILLAHDIIKVYKITLTEKRQLLLAQLTAFFVGVLALVLSLFFNDLMDIMLNLHGYYMPLIFAPLTLTIFGFRSTEASVLLGMFTSLIVVYYVKNYTDYHEVYLGILASFVALLGSRHYLLKHQGGIVRTKDDNTFIEIKKERKEKIHTFFAAIKNFQVSKYLAGTGKNAEFSFVFLGFFAIISIFFNLYSLPKPLIKSNWLLINVVTYITLFLSTILISYPAWMERFKKDTFLSFIAHGEICMMLFTSCILLIMNRYAALQIVLFSINLMIIASLLYWYMALLFISFGTIISVLFLKYCMDLNIDVGNVTTEFSIVYIALMACIISVIFIKPKIDTINFLEVKSHNLWQKVNSMDKEVRSANNLKAEFFNNINHEVRTPITGITSLGQALYDNYDQVPESKRRECVKVIAKNSERLISLMNNILDFSNLSSLKMPLNLKKINITEMVYDSLHRCKKLYLEDKELYFKLDIEDDVYTKCDVHYISHTIENLIINAICYSKPETTVRIFLQQSEGLTYFAIRDEGIGIPKEELETIFNPFTTSTKTKSTAGGRGIGLALCYAVIIAHKGRIWAESDGSSWAEFSFEIENTA